MFYSFTILCALIVVFSLQSSGITLATDDAVVKRDPPRDLGSPPSNFPSTAPPFQNGTNVILPNCLIVNCTAPVLNTSDTSSSSTPKRSLVQSNTKRVVNLLDYFLWRQVDMRYNNGLRIPRVREDYIRNDNRWWFRGLDRITVVETPLDTEPDFRPQRLLPPNINLQNLFQVEYIIPPWIIHQYASMYTRTGMVEGGTVMASAQDFQHLESITRYGGPEPPQALTAPFNQLNNLFGADEELINLRGNALARTANTLDPQLNNADRATLQSLLFLEETEFAHRHEMAATRVGLELRTMYPNSAGLPTGFAIFSTLVRARYIGNLRTRLGERFGIDPTPGDPVFVPPEQPEELEVPEVHLELRPRLLVIMWVLSSPDFLGGKIGKRVNGPSRT